MPKYKVILSGTAWHQTTYRVEAANPAEAESKVKSGDIECDSEDISDQTDTYTEVELVDEEKEEDDA